MFKDKNKNVSIRNWCHLISDISTCFQREKMFKFKNEFKMERLGMTLNLVKKEKQPREINTCMCNYNGASYNEVGILLNYTTFL